MLKTPACAALSPKSPLAPFSINRREPGPHDVLIDIRYCGVCHSDIHQVRNEWGGSLYPMVPGHEISGVVAAVGGKVRKFSPGDSAGVGPMTGSCRRCGACKEGEEQFCEEGMIATYNGYESDGKIPSYGGYSTRITVNEDYVLKIPAGMELERAAPLMCAGITTYSPLRRFDAGPGVEVAVAGFGGLGHMAVKFALAMGAKVSVLSHTPGKRTDARRLGAKTFIDTREGAFHKYVRRFDLIIDTIPVLHNYNAYLELLRRDGTMVVTGSPDPSPVSPDTLIMQRRSLAGTLVGGIRETREMLDFCALHGLAADVEVISAQKINEAFERIIACDIRFRFAVDLSTLK
ncbi:NAD(P)-dependent alcohol dehydrogenase [bacterium]|nr:MAG: NAD(P)-dependent alcohol dehydrogenase [bacterium]